MEKKKIKRSRNGCHNCKRLKIKCDEQKPLCSYCIRTDTKCDYSIVLTWGGRPYKDDTRRNKKAKYHQELPQPVLNPEPKYQFVLNSDPLPPKRSATTTPRPTSTLNAQETILPPPFISTNGDSMLKEYDGKIPQVPIDGADLLKTSPFTILESTTDISTGIENLSNALDRISNGGQQLNLQNSEMLNNFLLDMDGHNLEIDDTDFTFPTKIALKGFVKIGKDHSPTGEVPRIDIEEDYLANYSEDLARIEAYMPAQLPNYGGIALSPSNSIRNFLHSKWNPSDAEEDDEEDDLTSIHSGSKNYALTRRALEDQFSSPAPLLLPLPDILVQVPFYRYLMHFWVNVAADHLVPAPAHIYQENPFRVILPRLSQAYPSILTTLLAFSATIRSQLRGANDTPEVVIEQLLSRSCTELLKLLKDKSKATSDYALATVLMLSCYEVFHSRDFDRHRAHTVGARQIIMARYKRAEKILPNDEPGIPQGTEGDISFFLMRWFTYVDVIGALSSSKNSHNYLSSKGGMDSLTTTGSVTALNEGDQAMKSPSRDPKRDIDHILGFDVRFLPQFNEIAYLISRTDAYLASEGANRNNLPIDIVTRALEVKEAIIKVFQEGERKRQIQLDEFIDTKTQERRLEGRKGSINFENLIKQDHILRCTNKIFCDMGIINLYRRVLRVPRESQIIQELANGIGKRAQENIQSRSPADICTIFCSFTAGCETLDPEMRSFFRDRFMRLLEMGSVNALKGLQIMTRCWETNEDWIDASCALDIDIALL